MPPVVSDTSPLSLLVQLELVHLLESLFGVVVIPAEVRQELSHANAPANVRAFAAALPRWISVSAPSAMLPFATLDPGETASISLAVERDAPLLIDERAGRALARAHGVTVIGAIGILERAADLGLIADLAPVHAAIRSLPIRVADPILRASLARHRARMAGEISENS